MSSAEIQGRRWGARVGDWARLSAAISAPAWRAVADATAIGPGKRVLDLGCGSGEFCRLVVERGAGAAGIDASSEMIEAARAAAPEAELRVGDIAELPWPDEAFDVVSAFNSLQFAGDALGVLREARRVVKPGGAVAVCGWHGPGDVARVMGAAFSSILAPAPEPAPSPSLDEMAAVAGLTYMGSEIVEAQLSAADRATLVRALLATGPSAAAIEQVGEERARQAVAAAAAPFELADGSYRLENRFRCVITRR